MLVKDSLSWTRHMRKSLDYATPVQRQVCILPCHIIPGSAAINGRGGTEMSSEHACRDVKFRNQFH